MVKAYDNEDECLALMFEAANQEKVLGYEMKSVGLCGLILECRKSSAGCVV